MSVENSSVLDTVYDDLRQFLKISGDKRPVFEFPEYSSGKGLYQPDNEGERNTLLGKLLTADEPLIILASSSAFISPVAEIEKFNQDAIELKVGEENYSPEFV